MAKKVAGYIKLQVPAGQANPSPPVGPALGQHGVNIMEFCKAFNAQTQGVEPGLPIPVIITVYADRSFTFIKKTPPASILLKKAAGIKSGSGTPNSDALTTGPSPRRPRCRSTVSAEMNTDSTPAHRNPNSRYGAISASTDHDGDGRQHDARTGPAAFRRGRVWAVSFQLLAPSIDVGDPRL